MRAPDARSNPPATAPASTPLSPSCATREAASVAAAAGSAAAALPHARTSGAARPAPATLAASAARSSSRLPTKAGSSASSSGSGDSLQEAAARVLIELNRVGTSHQNLQSQFSGARVELDQVRIDIGLVATRVEQESMRTGDVIHRVDQLESGSCCPCSNLAARLIGEPEPTD